jgi:hypothetical protein
MYPLGIEIALVVAHLPVSKLSFLKEESRNHVASSQRHPDSRWFRHVAVRFYAAWPASGGAKPAILVETRLVETWGITLTGGTHAQHNLSKRRFSR